MPAIRKIKGSLVKENLEDYVGEYSYLFYDIETGELRISNGTPGGIAPRYPTATIDWTQTLGDPVHSTTLEEALNHIYSAGIVDGGLITDNLDGTIDVSELTCFIRSIDDQHGPLVLARVPGQTGITFTDNATNYVFVDYDTGVPYLGVTLDPTTINVTTRVPHSIIVREGTSLNIIRLADDSVDANAKLRKRLFYTERFTYSDGAVLSSPSLLNIAVTQGHFYFGLSPIFTPAIDTSGSDTFEYYWTADSGTTWTETDETVLDDGFYNDVTVGLVPTGNGRYVNHWLYVVPSTEGGQYYAVIYGDSEYTTLATALAEPVPTILPPSVKQIGILLGVYTTREGVPTPADIRSAFTSVLTSGTTTSHLELTDIGTTTHAQIDNQIPLVGTGSPEGVVTANPGRIYTDSNGGVGTTLYVKETGTGNTGWAAK